MTHVDGLKIYVNSVLRYILGDIDQLKEKGVTVSFPYLFLSLAAIDFLGGLQHGFHRDNSRMRSASFISQWMSRVNSRYQSLSNDDPKGQASYLYAFARSGLFHMACVQQSVAVSADHKFENHHLGYSKTAGRVFINSLKLADDFRAAADLFLNDLYSDSAKISNAWNNVQNYVAETSAQERKFPLTSLFYDLDAANLNAAETPATSSVQDISRFGTHGPL